MDPYQDKAMAPIWSRRCNEAHGKLVVAQRFLAAKQETADHLDMLKRSNNFTVSYI